ncbi:hypothetical protein HDIA_4597 [Hartmannibacter diazotrophicus]|uniref:Curlin minor subunit CsgB n=1 Tax=Hartmannibacter diazotrophicus TaxID=1482074 RepID=A0A2C9DDG6_9HYPH|nr:hypothetical protein [Hartmannibacter diazotrophicus]SON58138.1 hypothetical protein HDIA_4597 [Hartmannibacter diazotrophicus]
MTMARHIRIAACAAALGLLTAGAAPATAEDLLVHGFESAASSAGSLMQPIQPAGAGAATGSTSSIIQLGTDNHATAALTGSGHLAVVQQSGTGNRAMQAIEGTGSTALLVQGGSNNTVAQVSRGNDNFQLVGVSGSNNDVGYVQVGDQLAGVLDVRDAENTSVFALQTPQSGRFLMPTGIRGLENKVVVVVPGRMYVLPKR